MLAAQMRLVMLVAAEEAAVPATLDPAVAEFIDTWAPRTLEADLWAKVADAARQVVRTCVPTDADEAVRLLRAAGYLGAFVARRGPRCGRTRCSPRPPSPTSWPSSRSARRRLTARR